MTRPDDDATIDLGDNCDEPRDCTSLSRATFGGAIAAEVSHPDIATRVVMTIEALITRFNIGDMVPH